MQLVGAVALASVLIWTLSLELYSVALLLDSLRDSSYQVLFNEHNWCRVIVTRGTWNLSFFCVVYLLLSCLSCVRHLTLLHSIDSSFSSLPNNSTADSKAYFPHSDRTKVAPFIKHKSSLHSQSPFAVKC